MENAPAPLLSHIALWSDPARRAMWACRTMFHIVAQQADIGRLDETLKWQQPSWRPVKPRTGSTLRMSWSAQNPDQLALFVDCKTTLGARMRDLYPDLPDNDGRRRIAFDLRAPFPEQAVSHLAQMTFTYHLSRSAKSARKTSVG